MMRATSNMVIRPQLPARGSSLTRSLDCGALTAAGAGDTSSMSAPSSPITGSSSLESSGESPLGQSPPTLSAMSGRAAPNWAPSRQVAPRRLKSFDASSMDFSALSRRKQSIVVFDQGWVSSFFFFFSFFDSCLNPSSTFTRDGNSCLCCS